MLTIFSPDAFEKSSHGESERSKQFDWVKYRRYQWQNLPLGYRGLNFLIHTSADLKTTISNSPLQSKHWRYLCIGFNFDLLRFADWFQVNWDCFANLIDVAYPLWKLKSMLHKEMSQLAEDFDCLVRVATDLMKSSIIKLFCIAFDAIGCTFSMSSPTRLRA